MKERDISKTSSPNDSIDRNYSVRSKGILSFFGGELQAVSICGASYEEAADAGYSVSNATANVMPYILSSSRGDQHLATCVITETICNMHHFMTPFLDMDHLSLPPRTMTGIHSMITLPSTPGYQGFSAKLSGFGYILVKGRFSSAREDTAAANPSRSAPPPRRCAEACGPAWVLSSGVDLSRHSRKGCLEDIPQR
ncbi:hypothetical protein, partial [Sulfitobacter pontiacus]|uniref:hypothetical protein n=1 Tax=Sulfitobacter pontiacus TaxID=60137 RepID=UPI003296D330